MIYFLAIICVLRLIITLTSDKTTRKDITFALIQEAITWSVIFAAKHWLGLGPEVINVLCGIFSCEEAVDAYACLQEGNGEPLAGEIILTIKQEKEEKTEKEDDAS